MHRSHFAAAAVIAALAGSALAQCTPEWIPSPFGDFSSYGTDMPVDAATTWTAPGTPTRLVIAGRFNSVAGGAFSRIAVWDGQSWTALGGGLNGGVHAVFDFNGTLVATGQFTGAGGIQNIARWSGSAWQPMGTLDSWGNALQVHNGFLFVGGAFTNASGVPANHLARWNGTAWQAVNNGLNGDVYCLGLNSVSGASTPSLIIGGNFTTANGAAASRIVGYNLGLGSPWYTLGSGTNGPVYAIDGGYVGGSFTSAGGVSTGGFARWNGFNWQANGGFFAGTVYALADFHDPVTDTMKVIIGGFYPGINSSPSIAAYNGSAYTTLGIGGVGASGSAFCLTTYNSSLIVGGGFNSAGDVFVQNLARWSGSNTEGWSELRPGASAPVRALLPSGSAVYAGGDFIYRISSSDAAPHLAIASATGVNTVTNCFGCGFVTGTNGPVSALGYYTSGIPLPTTKLILGGTFTQAGGVNAANIAQFTSLGGYSAMGSGTDGPVNTVQQFGSRAIIGGSFSLAGGLTANGIAQWNGSWSTMGTGLTAEGGSRTADTMALYNGELLVGGHFAGANGVASPEIIRWNGTSFAAVPGATLSGTVRALAVFNNQLIAAGDFTSTAGPALDRVAAWDGTNWTPMNAGLPSGVVLSGTALAIHNGELYLGGQSPFGDFPGTPRSIYRWTGSAWTVVPGSPQRPVLALASAGGTLWAGGDFGVASGRSTPYLARFDCACYANCDNSSVAPILNVNDFACFLNAFASGDPYANCDRSTTPPVLNVLDFSCFLNAFAAGCT